MEDVTFGACKACMGGNIVAWSLSDLLQRGYEASWAAHSDLEETNSTPILVRDALVSLKVARKHAWEQGNKTLMRPLKIMSRDNKQLSCYTNGIPCGTE
jgi:hypothetical protein